MTDYNKYAELLLEIGEVLANKNRKIMLMTWEIEDLKKKIEELESGKVCATRIEGGNDAR